MGAGGLAHPTYHEDRHGYVASDPTALAGVVLRIRAVVHDLQRGPNALDRNSYLAKPGTARLTDLSTADLWASEAANTSAQAFAGWLVELDPV